MIPRLVAVCCALGVIVACGAEDGDQETPDAGSTTQTGGADSGTTLSDAGPGQDSGTSDQDAGVLQRTLTAELSNTPTTFGNVTFSPIQFKLRVMGYKGTESLYVSFKRPPAGYDGGTYVDSACLLGFQGTLKGNLGSTNTGTWTSENGGQCEATITRVDSTTGANGRFTGAFEGRLVLQGGMTNSAYVTNGSFEAY